ncbi:hypothetical protein ACN077_20830 [Clostridium chromiireducens]|uniref:hypothetical protein n=1 Tax=Clostridium chromiireducens TaxID=225345 RepID=UPI003AF4A602
MKKDEYWLRDSNNIHSVCEKAIYTYGAEHQKIKAQEEIGELIEALSDSLLGKEHNAEEETADVFIMLCQLKKMYQVDSKVIAYKPAPVGLNDILLTIKTLSKLSQAISRQLIGDEHDVENQIKNAETMLLRIMDGLNAEKIDRFIYTKLERLAGVVW